MKNKKIRIILLFFLFLFFIAVVMQSKIHRLKSNQDIPASLKSELTELASQALDHKDVPVGALLVYEEKIIGRGFNTVARDKNPAGHAEINAINDAINRLGMKKFQELDRKRLFILSTFEPCEMCKGTLLHYNIRKVYYMKDKTLFHWWTKQLKSFIFEWKKRKVHGESLQDSLFLMHPDYPGSK